MITDEMLSAAATELAAGILASLPRPEDCEHVFSLQFERKMRRVIRRGNHPVVYRTLQRVASIVLILMLSFGALMVGNAEVRAAVLGWIRQRYAEEFYEYTFGGEADEATAAEYELGWIPEGYELNEYVDMESWKTYVYYNDTNNKMVFQYIVSDKTTMYLDGVGYTEESVYVDGMKADLYISPNPLESSAIVWENKEEGVLFLIKACVDKEILIKMAWNVAQK